MAATNSIEHLDPAVIRPGRFDRHIRIDLPDADARRAIFAAELDDRPAATTIDLDDLVTPTEGMTPAAIAKIVDTAALEVFREATQTGEQLELDTEHLLAAVERYGGQDRPTVEHWSWDSLILPDAIKAQLQQLQAVIEDPESAKRFGVDPPTGLLLAGPPGTGKTTVAKVLAAQARASFYPISGADVISKWVGDSERNIRQLFERARENRPSIVFIDEIDAIAGRRGESLGVTRQPRQPAARGDRRRLAASGASSSIGATNRPDQLDPALLRGGRLSRTIFLGLPDEAGRLAMLRLHTARMPTVGVRLDELAGHEGFSPADLKALAQEAALAAMARRRPGGHQRRRRCGGRHPRRLPRRSLAVASRYGRADSVVLTQKEGFNVHDAYIRASAGKAHGRPHPGRVPAVVGLHDHRHPVADLLADRLPLRPPDGHGGRHRGRRSVHRRRCERVHSPADLDVRVEGVPHDLRSAVRPGRDRGADLPAPHVHRGRGDLLLLPPLQGSVRRVRGARPARGHRPVVDRADRGRAEILLAFWAAGNFGREAVLLVVWVGAAALARGVMEIALALRLYSLRDGR